MTKILIVEDEAMLRDVYAALFKMEKYQVAEAGNGKEAVRQLKLFKPDIVLLDVLMPVMGGIEFLEKTKIKQNHPHLKVLVLSNLSDTATLQQVTKLGATKYFLKASLSPTQLVEAVKSL
ncbi:MAG TPA: response regulator [Candidatus Limnocylindrales bacterium]|nr:response regulator [Candidatus Limnocylindrales bacterium]